LVEAAPTLIGSDWQVLGSGVIGTGQDISFTPDGLDESARFFRVRVAE
jgi:hypothetical protein